MMMKLGKLIISIIRPGLSLAKANKKDKIQPSQSSLIPENLLRINQGHKQRLAINKIVIT
jgi:hypothetical protein